MKTRDSKTIEVLLILLLLSFVPTRTYSWAASIQAGDPLVRRTWTTENGLPQNSVSSIVQTRDGYLWLGTFGGLARFDGVAFTVFDTVNTPGIKSNRIRALYEDAQGDLWIGTEHGGLTRYSRGVFTNYSLEEGLPSTSVLSMTGDASGDLWIGTLEGLTRLHKGVFTRFGPETGLPQAAIEAICQDSRGNLWLGADGVGLIRYAAGTVTHYTAKDGVHGDVLAIHADGHHKLWVGTWKGLTVFDEGESPARTSQKIDPIGAVRSIYEGDQGVVWIATERALFRFAKGEKTRVAAREGPSTSNLRSVFTDREQNLWIGTDGGGLDRWRTGNVRAYTAAQGLTDHPTMSILQDREGDIWVGALGGHALFRYRDGKFSFYPHQQDRIELMASLAEADGDSLWLGDWKYGLGRLNTKTRQLQHYDVPGLSPGVVRALYFDSAGALWIGADRTGLYRLKDGEFKNYRVGDGLPNDSVAFITEDRNHALWAATPTGIARLKGGTFTSYHAPGLSLVRSIHEDSQGTLWIGTYGYGLFRFKHGEFVQITTKDGLFDDVVSSILEDAHGNFWMSGNRAIFRVSRGDLDLFADGRLKAVQSVSYGVSDGMVVGETNGGGEPSGLKARDGKLWYPMIEGAVAVDPEIANKQTPPVVIERVTLEGCSTLHPVNRFGSRQVREISKSITPH